LEVSVVMCVRNVENYIAASVRSILDQTYRDFQLIIIDDFSSDNTSKIIRSFADERVFLYRNNQWLGIPKSRNRGLSLAKGTYVFYTDGDCIAYRNWIESGLKFFNDPNTAGVEGRIYYVSKDYKPTFSDHFIENRYGGNFMTGSIAYKRSVLESVGGFDENLHYLEDKGLAFKVMKLGKIRFNPAMVTCHQRVVFSPQTLIKSAAFVSGRVYLFQRFGERKFFLGRILFATDLVKVLFPPLVFGSLFVKRFKSESDYRLFPYIYIYYVCVRLHIWKASAEYRVFVM
jgi:glycosyltransferase involved in cell wall biosynthesis